MSTITRAHLRQALQDTGEFTYREARQAVDEIVRQFVRLLKEYGVLELPIGTLTVEKPLEGRAYRLGKIVRTGRKNKVHFEKKEFVEPWRNDVGTPDRNRKL